ncbi:MAG: HAD-IB family phosphatase [Opitutales bacterium]
MAKQLLIFDCDSTLSEIEGVDELARLKGSAVFEASEALTHQAMNGEVEVEAVFGKRLELIQPTLADCSVIGQKYIEKIEPTAEATLARARELGWTPIILSGGFAIVIEPLAKLLGVERVEAVPLQFDEAGKYAGFDSDYPTTRSGGKPEVIERLKAEFSPEKIVMVGDGVSDLETAPTVDRFIGFGRYTPRKRVKAEAEYFVYALDEVIGLLDF